MKVADSFILQDCSWQANFSPSPNHTIFFHFTPPKKIFFLWSSLWPVNLAKFINPYNPMWDCSKFPFTLWYYSFRLHKYINVCSLARKCSFLLKRVKKVVRETMNNEINQNYGYLLLGIILEFFTYVILTRKHRIEIWI